MSRLGTCSVDSVSPRTRDCFFGRPHTIGAFPSPPLLPKVFAPLFMGLHILERQGCGFALSTVCGKPKSKYGTCRFLCGLEGLLSVADKQRHRRLRLLLKGLNKERKKQAKQIDILCNDFVAAQRDFVRRLHVINFTAGFYESIIGTTDLNSLLQQAVTLMRDQIGDANVTFFLRQADNFELHIFENPTQTAGEKSNLENCFSPELMDAVCQSNKVCTLDNLFEMGLQGNVTGLSRLSAATVPLSVFGSSLGFILICRSAEKRLSSHELANVTAVAPGLSRAINCCRSISPVQGPGGLPQLD